MAIRLYPHPSIVQLRLLPLLSGAVFTLTGCRWIPETSALVSAAITAEQHLTVKQLYAVQSQTLALELNLGQVTYGQQTAYTAEKEDVIEEDELGQRWLQRDGKIQGVLVDGDRLLHSFDRYSGSGPSGKALSQGRYRLSSDSDPAYKNPVSPLQVFRKSRPTDIARTGIWDSAWPISHKLYFQWPKQLRAGDRYRLESLDGYWAPVEFDYQPRHSLSEAIHVSQIGFRPDEPKLAFLSTWMGDGGGITYEPGLAFEVINQATDQTTYRGNIQLRRRAEEPEDARQRNYSGTSVYEMRFDELAQPGNYRLCVEQIGCSADFPIGEEIWQHPFETAARGFYHQRSGIALEAPYSNVERPIAFGPQQPLVYQSKTPLLATTNGLGDSDPFTALLSSRTSQTVPEAWGGYFDAGDWDRRIQHLEVARMLLELVELFPDYAAELNLNLPESKNHLPDLLDEALWGLDLFRRMQLPDGGIRGGIESADHPRRGETSWQESLPVMAYAPDAWSSYLYAGVAAQAASLLEIFDPPLAQIYGASAEAAMAYGERHREQTDDPWGHAIADARNLAALELWRWKGQSQWHDLFLQTTVFSDPDTPAFHWQHHDQSHAAFRYSKLPPARQAQAQDSIQTNASRALIIQAEGSLELSQQTSFAWTRIAPYHPLGWGGSFGNPKLTALLRAHALTQDERYLKTALDAGQFSAGANPLNMTFTTAIGHRYPEHPLVIDQRTLGQPPPPGLTVYGPLDMKQFGKDWAVEAIASEVYPDIHSWPATETYFDVYLFPAVAEFTVMETMAPLAYAWGYFAARTDELSSTEIAKPPT